MLHLDALGLIVSCVTGLVAVIAILTFIGNRPKREEIRDMIDRSVLVVQKENEQAVTLLRQDISEIKSGMTKLTDSVTNLVINIGKICPYAESHKDG